MRQLQDMSLLLLSGFFYLFYREASLIFVLSFLLCLILCCVSYFTENRFISGILSLLFLAGGGFAPEFSCFYPAVFYVLLKGRFFLFLFPGIFVYGYSVHRFSSQPLLCYAWGGLMLIFTLFLWQKTETTDRLERDIMRLRDDSTENSLLLEEKNRALIEKQDYEIYAATLRERNRIAREIHDNVGHLLSRSILLTGAAKTVNTAAALAPVLDNLDSTLNHAMNSIRESVHDLHDESVNLKETVEALIKDFSFCPVTLDYDMGLEIPRSIKYCIISILKEALSNIARHSGASRASVLIREHPAFYQLCVEDNGTGGAPASGGIGLSNMRDRLLPLRGTMQINTEKGFHLFITIPKEQEQIL